MDTPDNIKSILRKLKKDEAEIGEFCIKRTEDALRSNGYEDARSWAMCILPVVLGELDQMEDPYELESLAFELEDVEKDIVEAVHDTFNYFMETLYDSDPHDIKDMMVYTVSKTLENWDKKKYMKLYG